MTRRNIAEELNPHIFRLRKESRLNVQYRTFLRYANIIHESQK